MTIRTLILPLSLTHTNTPQPAQNLVTNTHRHLYRCLLLHDSFHKYKNGGMRRRLHFFGLGIWEQSSKRSTLLRDVTLRNWLGFLQERKGKHGRLVFCIAFFHFYLLGSWKSDVNTPHLEHDHLSSTFNKQ